MKKVLVVLLILSLSLVSIFAGGNKEKEGNKVYKVGICQLVQHSALDAATKGFKDALTEELGDSVVFDEQNASGEITNCSTIINKFVSNKVDLILANATAPLTTAAAATTTIPILGTSITDYATALELENWNGTVGRNISGTSDLAPLGEQADMIKELFPNAKKVGLLYCSAEANSLYQIEIVEKALQGYGYKTTRYSFTDTNDVSSVTQKAATSEDVLYIPTDNTAASNTEAIANIVVPARVPVIVGEEGMCSGCGVAALSINYYDIGTMTGKMAARILRDGEDISTMPIEYAPKTTKKYNSKIAAELGVKIPSDYVAL